MTEEVPPTALTNVNLRLLCHDDIDAVKQLCGDWFPIEYVAVWVWVVGAWGQAGASALSCNPGLVLSRQLW